MQQRKLHTEERDSLYFTSSIIGGRWEDERAARTRAIMQTLTKTDEGREDIWKI
jgi:hypothetical protein